MITRIKNLIWLYKVNKNIKLLPDESYNRYQEKFFYHSKNFWFNKKKYKITRNLAASIIKQIRKEHPYKVIGQTEAEKLYKEYFTLENHIPNFESIKKGIYLKRFRDIYPIKSKKYSKYYINCNPCDYDVYKVVEKSEQGGSWKLINFKDDYWVESIDKDEITAYIFATKEEIEQFKSRKKEYKSIEDKVKQLYKEIKMLRESQRKLN